VNGGRIAMTVSQAGINRIEGDSEATRSSFMIASCYRLMEQSDLIK
jgi:hypothetical protein